MARGPIGFYYKDSIIWVAAEKLPPFLLTLHKIILQLMIGVFDSGVGGLSVWRELYREFPNETYLYVSDSGYCPYGPKTRDEILSRAKSITEFLILRGAEIIVVACNTATAAAIEYLRSHYNIPFVGMEPAVKPAAINTKTGAIGVLATKGTFKGELYLRTLHKFASNAKVLEQVGEGLVELVETGNTNSAMAREVIGKYITPMLEENVDHIVLGCTHYPFLESVIKEFAGDNVTIVNPAPAIARRAGEVLKQRRDLGYVAHSGVENITSTSFVTTGDNLNVLTQMVREIAPADFDTFKFAKIEIPYGNLQ